MKFESKTTLHGVKASQTEYEGKQYSSTTFYLPADLSNTATTKSLGSVTVPYKLGDHEEINKWLHLENAWPVGGVPVAASFEIVQGKDSQGKDAPKVVLLGIRPLAVPAVAPKV